TDYSRAIAALEVPLLVMAAAADRWAPPPACRALLDSVASTDRTWQLLARQTGFSRDFGHVDMLVGRAARAEVWPLIRKWLDARRRAPNDPPRGCPPAGCCRNGRAEAEPQCGAGRVVQCRCPPRRCAKETSSSSTAIRGGSSTSITTRPATCARSCR